MTATVLLARHGSHGDLGHVLSGRGDGGPLSYAGREQAERLADRLAAARLTEIHSSPQQRAIETAEIVAKRVGLAVRAVDALDEIDFGDWTGRAFDELEGDPAWLNWNERRGAACAPGGESMAGVARRAVAHIERLEDGGRLLCVSHCDVIRAIVAHYLGLPLDNLLRFEIGPASLSTMLVGEWGARLLSLNEGGGVPT